jgi:hypothetical protein
MIPDERGESFEKTVSGAFIDGEKGGEKGHPLPKIGKSGIENCSVG